MTAPTQPASAADNDQKSQKPQADKGKEIPRAAYDQGGLPALWLIDSID